MWSEIDAIVIHYSGMAHDLTGDYMARLRAIQNYHMGPGGLGVPSGGNDIAYNKAVSRNGARYDLRGWQVMSGATGADNDHTQAILFLGNDTPGRDDVTDKGRRAISQFLFEAEKLSGKKIGPVNVKRGGPGKLAVSGHRVYRSTGCPGDELFHFIATRGWQAYRTKVPIGYPRYFFRWFAWRHGEGEFKKYGKRNPAVRPKMPRLPTAAIYWAAEKRFLAARKKGK